MTFTGSRLLLLLSAILFLVAAIFALIGTRGDLIEPLALFAFAAWVGAGVV